MGRREIQPQLGFLSFEEGAEVQWCNTGLSGQNYGNSFYSVSTFKTNFGKRSFAYSAVTISSGLEAKPNASWEIALELANSVDSKKTLSEKRKIALFVCFFLSFFFCKTVPFNREFGAALLLQM